ncbi:hypothetical protein Terro_4291 [Terriglobus roseus DSM 18391]|uniref:HEAT repeat-containing protein n=1 Tax=Terriglobus roseus (strain DSM 18391 / NRRL B-41598 / KBS 63) TaxID=926566 RepID=I3ZMM0_TERRK|nr:HEAT repeat domain-containing protein [Terriglobus roseus]AFL90488.1 hypothetical protein Terro_4291 [Terriglobus roseus DSM 18391]
MIMSSNPSPKMARAVKPGLYVLLLCALSFGAGTGQEVQNQSDELHLALTKAKTGRVSARDVVVISHARALQAIPDLEEQFKQAKETDTKLSIASGLVQLKDNDDTYWNFLLDQATQAVDTDLPDPVFDAGGNVRQAPFLPEMAAWAQAHHVDVNTAGQLAMYGLPGRVMQLGLSGDPRAIPLLRRALSSHHSMIAIMAAKGLAQMQDKDSIPWIVDACGRSPRGLAAAIAEASLVFFDDPRAQAAVDLYMSPDRAKVFRESSAKRLKPIDP